ncbi:MAG TPA: V-type ATP synthase subunit E [Streptosporangiaceae bacterium]|nr:V-type ATP synthase subunit E [Streptosporangiaceae bacterium]
MTVLPGADAALAPVRAAMLTRSREQAAAIVARARGEAAGLVAQARQEAEDAIARARAEGSARAAALAAAERSRARRDARVVVLRAQRDLLETLRSQVAAAVGALRGEPGYDQLLRRLTALARQAAGPDATVTEHPDGGVIATAPGVVADCSLPWLADQAVAAIGPDLARLWADTPGSGEPAGAGPPGDRPRSS